MHCCFCPSIWVGARPHTSRRKVRRRVRVRVCAVSSSPSEEFGKDVRTLLCGELRGSARSILAQDLAKRAPEAFEDALRVRGLGGIADFARQIRDDIVPDVLKNGDVYVRTVREAAVRTANLRPTSIPNVDANTVAQELRNVFNTTPEGLYSPPYETVDRKDGYEIRRYQKMIVARAKMNIAGATEADNAAAMGEAFSTLASYLFGENEGATSMKMTTPVFMEKGGEQERMSFVIGEYQDVDSAPTPSGKVREAVEILETEGDVLYAVVEFSGFATVGEMTRRHMRLLEMLERDGVPLAVDADKAYKCVVYNGPTTLPFRRRQEILIPVLESSVTAANNDKSGKALDSPGDNIIDEDVPVA